MQIWDFKYVILIIVSITLLIFYLIGYKSNIDNKRIIFVCKRASVSFFVIIILTLLLIIKDQYANYKINTQIKLYPGSKIYNHWQEKHQENNQTWTYKHYHKPESIINFYKTKYNRNNWKIIPLFPYSDSGRLMFLKKGNLVMEISTNTHKSQTNISYKLIYAENGCFSTQKTILNLYTIWWPDALMCKAGKNNETT